MRPILLLIPLAVLAAAPALAQQPNKADEASIAGCLKQVSAEVEKFSKMTDAQRAKAEPPRDLSACVGAVAGPCREKEKGDPNKAALSCNMREVAVWNAIIQKEQANFAGDKDQPATSKDQMKKVQAAWESYRDARCAFPVMDNPKEPALGEALKSSCLLETTSRHAIWIAEGDQ